MEGGGGNLTTTYKQSRPIADALCMLHGTETRANKSKDGTVVGIMKGAALERGI